MNLYKAQVSYAEGIETFDLKYLVNDLLEATVGQPEAYVFTDIYKKDNYNVIKLVKLNKFKWVSA